MRMIYRTCHLAVAMGVISMTMFLSACSIREPDRVNAQSILDKLQSASSSPEWLTYGHDYGNQRFSPLSDIKSVNV